MNTSDESPKTPTPTAENLPQAPLQPASAGAMDEYYQLQKELYLWALGMTGIAFLSVWFFYSLTTALSYLIGSCAGVVYLRLLAKNVEGIGREKQRLGNTGLAVFIGVMIVAFQWKQLEIVPIFLGFLTYKAAIIAYVLRTTLTP
ncbi:ATP synthase subunit I [Roseofilum sp. BLCC_M91]|uniref:ATP synthase subunit I n=1 Tax=Roseofilum halophilum BLCC-M91 TaxID=3022259 RepID=A0ABT7BRF3_9CYAN|nr:ATP synthase subunit I [Roseofilum halophilum]MDJ1181084.1 ATP synthase subunit I [Roseofilum halophilum BLCC-M91]